MSFSNQRAITSAPAAKLMPLPGSGLIAF
jgi:hypothetical protein